MTGAYALTEEVRAALAGDGPVVALESTLIAHGLPWPINLETAMAAEAAVRDAGGVPATVAVVSGVITVGLSPMQLESLSRAQGVLKAGRRELAWAVAKGLTAATTVAGTLAVAAQVGIRTFATGGLGGVHRGAELSYDVSTDLWELARCPVAVVCSGAKGILNVSATLEVLETFAVPVVGYQTSDFPAFYVRSSGRRLAMRVDTPKQAATLVATQTALGGKGVVIAQPPSEGMSPEEFAEWLRVAEQEAAAAQVHGPEVTPFLLSRLAGLSGGRTLKINSDLIRRNAHLAGQISVQLSRHNADGSSAPDGSGQSRPFTLEC